ncbi:MAG: hypothetical protein KatS3mg045_1218 [Bellilinea sp.]|nr:MAG: hypothetical protein KatS3mg045_1218 [Bellilinea sp.]
MQGESKHQPFSNKVIGMILIATAILGWLISLSGLGLLWASYQPLRQTASEMLEVTRGALEVTSQTMLLVEDSLRQAEIGLEQVQTTLNGFSSVIETTSGVLEVVSGVLGDEFNGILRDTANAMEGLEKTSRLIDDTLGFISSVPFFGGSQYQPETPLAESVASMRQDLEGIPPALEQISNRLGETADGLQPLPGTIGNLTAQLAGIQNNLSHTHRQLDEYQAVIESYRSELERLTTTLPKVITGFYIGISILLVWIGLAQIGLFTQGLERLKKEQPGRGGVDLGTG